MVTEKFGNNPESTLNGSITAAATTITVNNGAVFTSPNFRINIEDELLLVTSVATNDLVVTRGYEGTTAATHGDGARVRQVLTAGALDSRQSDNVGFGASASKPSPERAGMIWFATDLNVMFYSDGSNWLPYGPIHLLQTPPTSGWAWDFQDSASVTNETDGILITKAVNTADYSRYERSLPSTPFSLILGFIDLTPGHTNNGFTFGLHEATAEYYNIVNWRADFRLYVQSRDSSFGTPSAITQTLPFRDFFLDAISWYKLDNDGTTIDAYFSADRVHWSLVNSTTVASVFTSAPDKFFWGPRNNDSNGIGYLKLVHYEEA